jgi:hypothetical protein
MWNPSPPLLHGQPKLIQLSLVYKSIYHLNVFATSSEFTPTSSHLPSCQPHCSFAIFWPSKNLRTWQSETCLFVLHSGSIEECMLCRDSTPEDNLFLTSCRHRFCFNCIKECVGVIIQAQMATRNLNFSSLAACPHCPITRLDLLSAIACVTEEVLIEILISSILQATDQA